MDSINHMDWVNALAGGLVGSILTLVGPALWKEFTSPRLRVIFDVPEAGCLATTPAAILGTTGQAPILGDQNYLRVKVKNSGRTYAKGVSVCVTKIGFQPKNSIWEPFDDEVLDLKLALTKDQVKFDLPAGGHRFVDLAHTSNFASSTATSFEFDFLITPFRYSKLNRAGTYKVHTLVSAENATSITKALQWEWDGTFGGLVIGR